VPTAAANASALRVDAGSAEILALTSSSTVFGTGSLRDRKRLKRVEVHRENAGQLQREERIPARQLVDPEQRLARERRSDPIAQKPMERPHAERPDDDVPGAVRTERAFELRPMRALDQPPCEQKADGVRVEPPQGEREGTRRGRVEPLNVVDGDQYRSRLAHKLQDVAHCNREGAVIDGIT
jgi:hypothetical protein